MPAKKYHVTLTAEERMALEQMLRRGKPSTRRLTRARILLKAAEGLHDDEIAAAIETSLPTVERSANGLPKAGSRRWRKNHGQASSPCSTSGEQPA